MVKLIVKKIWESLFLVKKNRNAENTYLRAEYRFYSSNF